MVLHLEILNIGVNVTNLILVFCNVPVKSYN